MTELATIILAAGKGTRMKSEQAKVLFSVGGEPMVRFPVLLGKALGAKRQVVVVGHQKQAVMKCLSDEPGVVFAQQKKQLGTAHAVKSALGALRGFNGRVLILSGDVPLLETGTVKKLQRAYDKVGGPLAFMSFTPDAPGNYGRVVVADGLPVEIVEAKDCSRAQKAISLVNAGIYLVEMKFLRAALKKVGKDNAQGEFYLTDLLAIAAKKGPVGMVEVDEEQVLGVNDRLDLARVQAVMNDRITTGLMKKGVSIPMRETVRIGRRCKVGIDTVIGPGVVIDGCTVIGRNVVIEQGVMIRDCVIADGAQIKAYSVLEDAHVGPLAEVGPMGRLRPGAKLLERAKVGNWVELKKVVLGKGSKANHLTYLGDGVVGDNVNLGAGCIFCNYDGFLKHQTVIGNNVFVGSDSQLVAPVNVGDGAYVASGTTVTGDVPKNALAISRGRQINKLGLAATIRRRLKKAKAEKLKKAARK